MCYDYRLMLDFNFVLAIKISVEWSATFSDFMGRQLYGSTQEINDIGHKSQGN